MYVSNFHYDALRDHSAGCIAAAKRPAAKFMRNKFHTAGGNPAYATLLAVLGSTLLITDILPS